MAVVITQSLTTGQAIAALNDKYIIFNSDTVGKVPQKATISIEEIDSTSTKVFTISPDASEVFYFNIKEAVKSFFVEKEDTYNYAVDNQDQIGILYYKFDFDITITQDDESTESESINNVLAIKGESSFYDSSFLSLSDGSQLLPRNLPNLYTGFPLSVSVYRSLTGTIERRLISDGSTSQNIGLIGNTYDTDGVYLKWKNNYGGYSYFLFEKAFTENIESRSNGQVNKNLTEDLLGKVSNFYEIDREGAIRINVKADSADLNELLSLRTLIESNEVYIYTGDKGQQASSSDWLRCQGVTQNYQFISKRVNQRFELSLELPKGTTSEFISRVLGNYECVLNVNDPSNLVATTLDDKQIDLYWSDNSSGETGFEIHRSTTSGSGFSLIDTVGAGIESYSDTGLSEGTTYYYKVKAIGDEGVESDFSNEASDTTLTAFSTNWKTDNVGTSSNNQITLPLVATGIYDMVVDFGDGNTETITSYNQSEVTHTYSGVGTYTVRIVGTCRGWAFADGGDKDKILVVNNWGQIQPISSEIGVFHGCKNLVATPTDILDLSQTNTMESFFEGCSSLTTVSNINQWDTSGILSIARMFIDSNFNDDISGWDVSSVITILGTFTRTPFNQDIDSWSVQNVATFQQAFQECSSFNQSLNSWDVSNSTNMDRMFKQSAMNSNISSWQPSSCLSMLEMFYDTPFNQNISGWTVSAVTNMKGMFELSNFDQVLSPWVVSAVTNFSRMFINSDFSQDVGGWNTISATNMLGMFKNCTSFNHSLNSWNVSSVTDMSSMFDGCTLFNQSLNNWNVGLVTTMNYMFANCPAFNGNITSWDVSSVSTFLDAFNGCSAFNQDIGGWTTTSMTNIASMLEYCVAFNRDISGWDVTNLTTAADFMENTNLSVANYGNLLAGWESQAIQDDVIIGFGTTNYDSGDAAAVAARSALLTDHNWTIIDGGAI